MATFTRLKRHYAPYGNYRVAFACEGHGPPVVLLHGLGGTADFWQPVVEHLRERYTLVVLDLLGFGYSDKPRLAYRLSDHVGAAVATCKYAVQEPLHALVGHSAGCVIATALAASGLVRPAKLALAAAPYPAPRFNLRAEMIKGRWFQLLFCNRTVASIDTALWRTLWPLSRFARVPAYLRGGLVGMMDYTANSYYDTVTELLFTGDITALLPRLARQPTLLLNAADDGTVPPIHAERLAEAMPWAERVLLEKGGHYAVINEGLESLSRFLASES
jgi:aminoacrylate hydrolase